MPDPLLKHWRIRVDAALKRALPDPQTPPRRLHAAMQHAVLLGGKRMRPLLVYASGALFGADETALDAPAAAVELIHAYSLVHDDLPAMDDDALRRGQPTVHVAFDEATAILAGDALQSLAFELLAETQVTDGVRVQLLRTLAQAAGAAGMCGGQALDIDATAPRRHSASTHSNAPQRADGGRLRDPGQSPAVTVEYLERMHALKTGALSRASVRLGALCGGASEDELQRLDRYASALGLAFQVRDDILDVEGNSVTLGKTAGKDAAQDKATFPALIGLPASRERLDELAREMFEALEPFDGRGDTLAALARITIERDS
jgi:farnesyl diphosphate synthase